MVVASLAQTIDLVGGRATSRVVSDKVEDFLGVAIVLEFHNATRGHDCGTEKAFGITIVQDHVRCDREGASTFTEESNPGWIATKLANVFLDPLHGDTSVHRIS